MIKATDIGNGQTYTAKVVGYDKTDDIAVLQLEGASGLPTASLGNSSQVTSGEQVVALGNAGGKGGTPSVAAGTITALNQSITASDDGSGSSEQLSGMLETNADIQPGDSGGPLVNTAGRSSASTPRPRRRAIRVPVRPVTVRPVTLRPVALRAVTVRPVHRPASHRTASRPTGSRPTARPPRVPGPLGPVLVRVVPDPGLRDPDQPGPVHRQPDRGRRPLQSTVHSAPPPVPRRGTGSQDSSFGRWRAEQLRRDGARAPLPGSPAGRRGGPVRRRRDHLGRRPGRVVPVANIASVVEPHHPGDQVSVGWTDESGQTHTSTLTLASGPAD